MKRVALICAALFAACILAGCGGGGGGGDCGPKPRTCKDLARQLQQAGKWELWVLQKGEPCPTPLCSRTEKHPLRANVDTWFFAKICAAGGYPEVLIDFRCPPPGNICLRGQIDKEAPVKGYFQFKYDGEVCPVRFDCAPADWMTTRGIRLTIEDVEVCIGEPYCFVTR